MASAVPTARVSRCVPPAPGMTPIRISGWPNWASSPATMRSHVMASSQPPPRAKPRTAAIERQADRADAVPGREVALGVQPLGGLVGELHDVGTGRERSVAGAGQDDDPDAIVEVERLELVGQLGQEREAERVARLGPVDRDERDAVMPGDGGIDTDQAGGRLDVGHAGSSLVVRSSIHVPGSATPGFPDQRGHAARRRCPPPYVIRTDRRRSPGECDDRPHQGPRSPLQQRLAGWDRQDRSTRTGRLRRWRGPYEGGLRAGFRWRHRKRRRTRVRRR